MDNVHFLNLEYILLRVFDVVNSVFATFGFPLDGSQTPEGQASSAAHWGTGISFTLGLVAIVGMALTLVLLVLSAWTRIKLLVVEHEGFHGHGHEHGGSAHDAHAADDHVPAHALEQPKNPQWERVHELANSAHESDWRRAILEADIMLGKVLDEQGYRGKEIGEKLRDANPLQFTTLDFAWKAHKIRNDIAHGGESYHLSQRDTHAAVDFYRRVFEEFDYI